MTTGVLLYSFNTDQHRYSNITKRCIHHIRTHLGLPVTVVGDGGFDGVNNIKISPTPGNQRRYQDKMVPWYNYERANVYDHSPYDTTILMDCDYFVMSDRLLELCDSVDDILVHDRVYDITHQHNLWDTRDGLIPLVWATVVIFKKNTWVSSVFDMIKHVRNYYHHYRNLYRIKHKNYRNDYAFAIALHQMYGFNSADYCLPEPMFMMGADAKILDITDNALTYNWKTYQATLENQDVHVFDKEYWND